jgi:hypothetical protein
MIRCVVGGQSNIISDEVIDELRRKLIDHPEWSRRKLSQWLCQRLGWKDALGRWRTMSARVVLNRLQDRKQIQLPKAGKAVGKPRRWEPWQAPQIQSSLQELGPVKLVEVTGAQKKLSRLWNTLIQQFHPQGYQRMAGAQIRYLLSSRQGWLGALGWGAGAWSIKDRDRRIGWSGRARREHLPLVVCNWRFLILPTVRVPHLASHVLAQCHKQLSKDWRRRYGYEPVLLETFVERGKYKGSSYQAANWQKVGQTQGRGRNDRRHQGALTTKDIYVYGLVKDWRQRLCQESPQPVQPTGRPALSDWTQEEWAGAVMPDQRLAERLRLLAGDFYHRPQANIPQACGSRAKTKAAYRFVEHPDIEMESILGPHREATLRRMAAQSVVLAVQDSTGVSYGDRPASQGLGLTNHDNDEAVGFWLHNTMAYSLEGLALGLLDVQVWARKPAAERLRQRNRQPIEDKESVKWVRSFERIAQCQQRLPQTQIVSVGDREADVYELFVAAREQADVAKLLIRVQHKHRSLQPAEGLWKQLCRQPVAGRVDVKIGRRGPQAARTARLEVRFCKVELKPPKAKPKLGAVGAWAVLATEPQAPKRVKPIEWMLLTTMPVPDLASAVEKLNWYALRTLIEGFHRTIKSGCRIEKRQLLTADRLQRCLAIDLVVGWRIQYMSRLGRQNPESPCTVVFENSEWKALYGFVHRTLNIPKKPPTLQTIIRMVASLGGFLGRKGDGEPGMQTLWLGLHRLQDISATWNLCQQLMQRTRGP